MRKITLLVTILLLTGLVLVGARCSQKENKLGGGTEPEKKEKVSELTSLDEIWNLYTNHELGFSIKVPKKVLHEYGACQWKDDSYRGVAEFVPIKVFENEKVYISTEYYYEPTGRTVKPEGGVTFSGCDKVTNTLTLLEDRENFYQRRWGIVIETVKNDKELDEFIKEQYGSDCALGDKKLSEQEGVYDVTATGQPPACFINYASTLKYYPQKNKVAFWGRGQDVTFWGDKDHTVVYDGEIVNSFKFR